MKINQKGIDIIKESESFSAVPYICPAGVPTIGYGTTRYQDGSRVTMKDKPITKEKANEIMATVVNSFSEELQKVIKKPLTDNQFSACVSLAYNIGTAKFAGSTLVKLLNVNPNDPRIFDEFLKWNKGAGKVLQGLVIRRNKEARLYFEK